MLDRIADVDELVGVDVWRNDSASGRSGYGSDRGKRTPVSD